MKPQTAFVTHNHVFHFTHMHQTAGLSIGRAPVLGFIETQGTTHKLKPRIQVRFQNQGHSQGGGE